MVILRKTILPLMILALLFVLPLASDFQYESRADTPALLDSPSVPVVAIELDQASRTEALASYGNLPLLFIPNNGQMDSSVLYYVPVSGGKVYLTSGSIVLNLTRRKPVSEGQQAGYQQLVLRLNLAGANDNPIVLCRETSQGRVNYFIGNNPAKWFTDISTYKEIVYSDIYPNIDLRLYGKAGALTYDFIVHPGGDVSNIRLSLEGIENLDLSGRDLVLNTAFGQMSQGRLSIYQGDGVCRQEIEGNFKLLSDTGYGFEVAAYDSQRDLVIDPALVYSTYLGGGGGDSGYGIAVDAAGNAYITGTTSSNPFPTTPGAFQTFYQAGAYDAFVTKLNATGSALVYSTYLGGAGNDEGWGIAVDAAGNAYLTGRTNSDETGFPLTPGAFQIIYGGGDDAFIAKLNPAGNALVYCSYLGGVSQEIAWSVALDAAGNAYIAGNTNSDNVTFPYTAGAFQTAYGGNCDAFVTKLNAAGSALVYSTYLGGSANTEQGYGIAVDAAGNAYVGGWTSSNNFPTTPGAFQTVNSGSIYDAFVTKLNPAGSALAYSTLLGGTGDDRGRGIAVDATGNAYVTGWTYSIDFPTTPGAFQTVNQGTVWDGFITKLNAAGSALVYSTYLGGSGISGDYGRAIAVDSFGNAYVAGITDSNNFPTTPGHFQMTASGLNGLDDAFVTKLNPTGSALRYSHYLGGADHDFGYGIALDAAGNAYLTGATGSDNFPTTPGAFQTAFAGGGDAFVTEVSFADQPHYEVKTATGTGIATFATSSGNILNLTAVAVQDCGCTGTPGPFPHGLFSFTIIGLTPGETVIVTITLPTPLPAGSQYWKCINGLHWVNGTSFLGSNDGDNVITLTLTDGGPLDADEQLNGTIVDPGGPALPVLGATVPAHPASPTLPTQLKPAQISLQYLSVNPKQTTANQPVTITTNVVNTGDQSGNLNVTLKINGQVEETRMVSVGPQASQPIKFTVAKSQPGTYSIDIGGQTGSFTIPDSQSNKGAPVNTGMIIFLVMAVLVIAAVMVLLLSRRSA